MGSIFVSRIPKGLKHSPVSRVIKQGIETVAQVKKIWIHPSKGYAFVDLFCDSSIDIVLTLDKRIEVNNVPLQIERYRKTARWKRQHASKKHVEHDRNAKCTTADISFIGYCTYTEYKQDRCNIEWGIAPVAVSLRKQKKKPWKKDRIQLPVTSQKPTSPKHYRKRKVHQFPSSKAGVERRDLIKTRVYGSFTDENTFTSCHNDAVKHSNHPTNCGNFSLKPNHSLSLRDPAPSNPVTKNVIRQLVRVHVYQSSKYLFDIDVDNNKDLVSIQTAVCQKKNIPSYLILLFFNGRLLDKTYQPLMTDDDNIHMTVKGFGGMNNDNQQKSTIDWKSAQTGTTEKTNEKDTDRYFKREDCTSHGKSKSLDWHSGRKTTIPVCSDVSSRISNKIAADDKYDSLLDTESPQSVRKQAVSKYDHALPLKNELRIVLIGKTGVGKSATCNTILGAETFTSKTAGASVTRECECDKTRRFGKNILVVDTPGMYDTGLSIEETKEEVSSLVSLSVPGPHAIILVVTIGRFTKEEQEAVRHLADLFGDDMYKYLIVLFTRRDELERQSESLEEFIKNGTQNLRDLLNMCNNRYIAFDNTGPIEKRDGDARHLIDMVDQVVERNGGSYYTNSLYEEAVEFFRIRELERQREIEEQGRLHDEQIRRKVQDECKRKLQKMEETNKRLAIQQQNITELLISYENKIIKMNNQMDRRDTEESGDDPKKETQLREDVENTKLQENKEEKNQHQLLLDAFEDAKREDREIKRWLLEEEIRGKLYQQAMKERIVKMENEYEKQLKSLKISSYERKIEILELKEKLKKRRKKNWCPIS